MRPSVGPSTELRTNGLEGWGWFDGLTTNGYGDDQDAVVRRAQHQRVGDDRDAVVRRAHHERIGGLTTDGWGMTGTRWFDGLTTNG